MEDLRISLIQSSLHWENRDANLKMFEEKIAFIPNNSTDLIVLPEMFTTGFTMNAPSNFEDMNGKTFQWMQAISRKKNCVVTGSIIIKENDKYFNRLIWMRPDGSFEIYDKRHLFRLANEDATYTSGNKRLIVELKGWKICPMICYDLRFPAWCRNQKDYDVLIFVANWPERRVYAWKQLLIARAIENQSYVIGVNRVGEDGSGVIHSGDSTVLDFMGKPLSNIIPHKEMIETVTLSFKELEEFRTAFPFALDADNFIIKN
jgi:omega-amidase